MTKQNINFQISDDSHHVYAICDGRKIGSLFFLRIGFDKIMISESEIEPDYKNQDLELHMIEQVINIARQQHRKVITICPYLSDIFKKHPEFDDVRLLNNSR